MENQGSFQGKIENSKQNSAKPKKKKTSTVGDFKNYPIISNFS